MGKADSTLSAARLQSMNWRLPTPVFRHKSLDVCRKDHKVLMKREFVDGEQKSNSWTFQRLKNKARNN
jgi:hypothetical protein